MSVYVVSLGATAPCRPQYLDGDCVSCCNPPPVVAPPPPPRPTTTTARTTTTAPRPGPPSATTPVARTTTTTPVRVVPQDFNQICGDALSRWMGNNPVVASCMSDADKSALRQVCVDAYNGRQTLDQFAAAVQQTSARACERQCEDMLEDHVDRHPEHAVCFSGQPRDQALQACRDHYAGRLSSSQLASRMADLVSTACPPAPPPPATTDAGTTTPGAAAEPSMFRKWGPIIGIAVVLGAGVYIVRKK